MNRISGVFLLALLGCSPAHARDGFEKVRCDGDIARALVGQRDSNEPVVAIESRHKDLGLRDLGGDEIDDRVSSVSWLICGREFTVLVDNRTSTVHDALEMPPHSKARPEFFGSCRRGGRPAPEAIVAILREEEGKDELAAEAAWKIDAKAIRFVKIAADDLLCPRSGIVERSH
ncbi:MAG: hypothetical protein ABSG83_01530 [Roseiarcus sp.]